MKLNLDFYKQDLLYNECEDEKQIIDKYINCYKENEFEEIITNNDVTLNEFSSLTEIRKNIISWYPFKENATILEIGANLGEITGELCKNQNDVVSVAFSKQRGEAIAKRHENINNLEVIVGNLQDIKFNKKFDYIVLIGILEYANEIYKTENSLEDLLIFLKTLLKEDGHILIATNNKFGMRNWSNIAINENDIRYDCVSTDKPKSINQIYSKAKLEEIFDKIDIGQRKYYYPLPDYKLTSVIFTDNHLPNEEKILRNIPIFNKNEIINFNENSAYIQLLKRNKNLFPFFANSFFIDISNNLEENNIEYVSFGNMKKTKYRLKTIIKNDIVYKMPTNEKSKEHMQEIKQNIDILNKHGINILDTYDNEKIISKYIKKGRTYDEIILDEFKINGIKRCYK